MYGTVENFHAGLRLESVVSDGEHARMRLFGPVYRWLRLAADSLFKPLGESLLAKLDQFYDIYEPCFPLQEERKSKEGFHRNLFNNNFDKKILRAIGDGKYREFCTTLYAPDGTKIGGVNFGLYIHKNGPPTVHSTYYFLAPEYRGMKLASQLVKLRDQMVMEYLAKTAPKTLRTYGHFLDIAEFNNPEEMSTGGYASDSADAVDRLHMWRSMGFKRLDMPYAQPELDPGSGPCEYLSLNVRRRNIVQNTDGAFALGDRAGDVSNVPASHINNHLRAFYIQHATSNPHAAEEDPTARRILGHLAGLGSADIATVADNRYDKKYLQFWGACITQLKTLYADTPLSDDETILQMHNRTYDPAGADHNSAYKTMVDDLLEKLGLAGPPLSPSACYAPPRASAQLLSVSRGRLSIRAKRISLRPPLRVLAA